jgi:hypothetical protein
MYGGYGNLYCLDQDDRVKTLLRRTGAGVGGFRVGCIAVSPHDGSLWVGTGSGLEVSFEVSSADRIIFRGDRGSSWYAARHDRQRNTPKLLFADPLDRDRAYSVSDVASAMFLMRLAFRHFTDLGTVSFRDYGTGGS